jgi:CDP-diacylglycerol--glycerol-3-phosphate 3-phosphatidyltransferase
MDFWSMRLRHIPNLITLARLCLAVACFWFLGDLVKATDPAVIEDRALWAFWLFLAASLSDFLDGWLARKKNWVSALGRIADPVADKVLMLGTATYLTAAHNLAQPGDFLAVMPIWAVVLLLAREFLVTALRGVIESKDMQFPADKFGKWKLIVQAFYLAIPTGVAGRAPEYLGLDFLMLTRTPVFFVVIFWLMIGLTVVSGLNYVIRGTRMLAGANSS